MSSFGRWRKNISRVCVVGNKKVEGWYGVNVGNGYRIGYAQSKDGMSWTRIDKQVGINLSTGGWDSQAQSYPYIVDTNMDATCFIMETALVDQDFMPYGVKLTF